MDARLLFDLDTMVPDIRITGSQIEEESGLETALLLSIFTDRRAEADDRLPETHSAPGFTDRRGWWGDTFPDVEGDRFGSRLWLLSREKMTGETLARAIESLRESLAWLVEDGIAQTVEVTGEWLGRYPEKHGRFRVQIVRPLAPEITFRFQYVWDGVGG